MRPPVKESTRPIDLRLHSDVRAVERAEFDNQVFCYYNHFWQVLLLLFHSLLKDLSHMLTCIASCFER